VEDEQYLENIRSGGTRITDLVEDVRVVMDTVTGEHHRTVVELSELVAEEVEHARDRFPAATFETDIQPNVEAVGNTTFRAVITNLLQNAVEHNDTDSPTVGVSVYTEARRARIEVADDGPGFPDGLQERVFERGEKDPTSRGMGIGLYLVEVLVEAVDGSVSIEDNEPRGAVVTVELQLPEEFRSH
jgi:signal transduction histidine kinase